MSIINLMKNEKLMIEFDQVFSMPKMSINKPMLAKPLSQNYMLVGTAFDYLTRFFIERNNEVINHKWISIETIDLARYDKTLKKEFKKIIIDSKRGHKQYLKTGILSDSLVRSTLLLAKLDNILRSGGDLPVSFEIENGDVEDLKNLYLLLPEEFKNKKQCVLNPTFGVASLMIGGADADLIIDNQLIDIKTTTDFTFKREYFLQLIGYYILTQIGGVDGVNKKIEIDSLGIYFARHGYIFSFDFKGIIKDYGRFDKFITLFIDVAQKFQ